MNLDELEDKVCDQETFLEFLGALAVDREESENKEEKNPSNPYGPSHNGWENGSISSFLGAANAWANSSINGLPMMEKEENPWKRMAQILHAGKFYE
jgi:hypothetical protein